MEYLKLTHIDFIDLLHKRGYTGKQIKKHKEKFYMLFTLIIQKMNCSNTKKLSRNGVNDIFAFRLKKYEKVFGQIRLVVDKKETRRKFINRMMRDFEHWEIIKRKDFTPKGCKFRICHIKVNPAIINKISKINYEEDLLDTNDFKKLEEKVKTAETQVLDFIEEENLPTYTTLQLHTTQVEIDKNAAFQYISNSTNKNIFLGYEKNKNKEVVKKTLTQNKAHHWRMAINNYSNKYHRISRKTHRYYTNITNLPSKVRPFLHCKGKKFIEIDIKNSQPLLLNILINDWLNNEAEINLYSEEQLGQLKNFKKICEKGEFYKHFMTCMEVDPRTCKVDIFANVFFGREYKDNPYRAVLQKHFKIVDDYISYIKRNNYKELSLKLQKLEADLIINNISKELIIQSKNPFFTIHDAIYCLSEDVGKVEDIIQKEYAKVGLNPSVHIKAL